MQLPDMKKIKQYFPMQHLFVIDKNKQKIDIVLSYQILCPLCHLQKKKNQKEVHAIKDLPQCSRSSAYCQKKPSRKRGHLIAQVHNTAVEWSIKPFIVQRKKFSKTLRQK